MKVKLFFHTMLLLVNESRSACKDARPAESKMMLCLRKGAKVCGKRTLYFFTDFTRESNVTVVVVSPARSVYVSPLVSFGQLITTEL